MSNIITNPGRKRNEASPALGTVRRRLDDPAPDVRSAAEAMIKAIFKFDP